jgi:hypothetical protein
MIDYLLVGFDAKNFALLDFYRRGRILIAAAEEGFAFPALL